MELEKTETLEEQLNKLNDTDLHKTQEKQNINNTKNLVKKFIILHKQHFIKY